MSIGQYVKRLSTRTVTTSDGARWGIVPASNLDLIAEGIPAILGAAEGARAMKRQQLEALGHTPEEIAALEAESPTVQEQAEAETESATADSLVAGAQAAVEGLKTLTTIDAMVCSGVRTLAPILEDGTVGESEEITILSEDGHMGDAGLISVSLLPIEIRMEIGMEVLSMTMEGAEKRIAGFRGAS